MIELLTISLALVGTLLAYRRGYSAGSARERKALTNWYAELERIREHKLKTGDKRQYVIEVDQNCVARSYPLESTPSC